MSDARSVAIIMRTRGGLACARDRAVLERSSAKRIDPEPKSIAGSHK
jgi:hypothetical protein